MKRAAAVIAVAAVWLFMLATNSGTSSAENRPVLGVVKDESLLVPQTNDPMRCFAVRFFEFDADPNLISVSGTLRGIAPSGNIIVSGPPYNDDIYEFSLGGLKTFTAPANKHRFSFGTFSSGSGCATALASLGSFVINGGDAGIIGNYATPATATPPAATSTPPPTWTPTQTFTPTPTNTSTPTPTFTPTATRTSTPTPTPIPPTPPTSTPTFTPIPPTPPTSTPTFTRTPTPIPPTPTATPTVIGGTVPDPITPTPIPSLGTGRIEIQVEWFGGGSGMAASIDGVTHFTDASTTGNIQVGVGDHLITTDAPSDIVGILTCHRNNASGRIVARDTDFRPSVTVTVGAGQKVFCLLSELRIPSACYTKVPFASVTVADGGLTRLTDGNDFVAMRRAGAVNTLGGDDCVLGSPGADLINLGDGDDYASSGGGLAIINGQGGDDVIVVSGGGRLAIVDGGPGNDTCTGTIRNRRSCEH